MTTANTAATDTLNHLIIIADDGYLGYKEAAEYAENPVLKASCLRYAAERNEFAGELRGYVKAAGTAPETGSGPLAALHRVWMDIKTSFTANNDAGVAEDCIRGEETAVAAYEDALAHTPADASWEPVLQRHLKLVKDALFDLQQQAQQLKN